MNTKTRRLATTGLLAAICIVLGLTVGYIPGPVAKLTLMHIPVIIGAILIGWRAGLFLGLIFGLTSIAQLFMFPSIFLPIFEAKPVSTLLILIIPRLIVPLSAYVVYKAMAKLFKNKLDPISVGIASGIGSLANTVLVLFGIFWLVAPEFATAYGTAVNQVGAVLLGIAGFNGLIEAAIAVVLCIPIILAVKKSRNRQKTKTES